MSEPKREIIPITPDEQRKVLLDAVDKMTEVLWFFFEGDEEFTDKDQEAEFVGLMFDIALISIAATGFKAVGKSPDGRHYVEISPVSSVKELLKEKSVGQENSQYYETRYLDPASPFSSDFVTNEDGSKVINLGQWEDLFVSKDE